VIYSGWCDGGPLAGRQLAYDRPRYRVWTYNGTHENATMEGTEYVFDEGAWRWRPPYNPKPRS